MAILSSAIEEWHVEDDIYNLSTIFSLLRDLEDQRLIQRRLNELTAFRRPLLKRKGSLLPPLYTMATGPRACKGFVDWTARTYDTHLVKYHPDLCNVVTGLRPLRMPINPKADEFSPSESTVEETKPKGRFPSPSSDAPFSSNDDRDIRLGKIKVAAKPSRGKYSSGQLKNQSVTSELAELRSDMGKVLEQLSVITIRCRILPSTLLKYYGRL